MSRYSIRSLVLIMAASLLVLLVASASVAFLSKRALSTDVHHAKLVMQQNSRLMQVKNLIDLARVDALLATRGDSAAFATLGDHLQEAIVKIEGARTVFAPPEFPAVTQAESYQLMLDAAEDIAALQSGLSALASLPIDSLTQEIDLQILPVLEQHTTILQTESDTIGAQVDAVRKATLDKMAQGLAVQVAVAVFAIVVGLVVSFVVARALAKPISASAEAVKRLADQDYKSDIPGTERRDEIGSISTNLVSLRDRLAKAEAANEKERQTSEKRVELFDELGEAMRDLADGHTQCTLDGSQYDSLGADYVALCENFNSLSSTLSALVLAIGTSSKSVAENASDLSSMSDDLSRRAETQAATLEQTAAAIEELSQSVNQAAERATSADTKVVENRNQAEEGRLVMDRALEAMQSIARSSERINQILAVIDDIAFQTNLLALNAGVEAARAGETGKGFSVVASEVRSLAQRAAESASEIKDLVTQSSKEVEQGGILVQETSEKLGLIVDNVAEVSSLVAEIASSTKAQAQGVQEINSGMSELDRVTQKNAAMVLETSAASNGLSNEAQKLENHLAKFTVSQSDASALELTAANEPDIANVKTEPALDTWEVAPASEVPEKTETPPTKLAVGSDDIWEEF